MGLTVLIWSQNDHKGTISASNDRFAQWDRGKFQDKLRVFKIAIKSIGKANGALVTSFFGHKWKSPPPLKSVMRTK